MLFFIFVLRFLTYVKFIATRPKTDNKLFCLIWTLFSFVWRELHIMKNHDVQNILNRYFIFYTID